LHYKEEKVHEILYNNKIFHPGEIDVYKIARSMNLEIRIGPLDSVDGALIYNNLKGIIVVSNRIIIVAKKVYTIGHELSHYINERHEHKCIHKDFLFSTTKARERAANEFAAELLLPTDWVKKYVKWNSNGLQTIENMKRTFVNPGIITTAIKYAQIGDTPIAAIMSENNKVTWKCINPEFPYQELSIGQTLNDRTNAHNFYENKSKSKRIHRLSSELWFPHDKNANVLSLIHEQNIYMQNYSSVLTILWQ
jgi:Zn-dependent peptidase ImmA (M78 family)